MNIEHCKQHPKYKGLRKPRVNCNDCWLYWGRDKIQTVILTTLNGRRTYFSGRAGQLHGAEDIRLPIQVVEPVPLFLDLSLETLETLKR